MLKSFLLTVTVAAALASTASAGEEPRKLAFVDTGNTGRSVTAEALANQLVAKQHMPISVISRAVDVDPFVVSPEANVQTLLKKRGLNVAKHIATQLNAQDVKHADIILTMTAKHKARVLAAYPEVKDKIFTLAEYATGTDAEVADAYGKPMDVYVKMVDQVNGYLPAVIAKVAAIPAKQ